LNDGTYSNCTIIVTDSDGNASNTLTITSFIVDTTTTKSYVSVGNSGTILTSSDNGTSWNSMTSGTSKNLNDVTYGNSIFVTVGYGGTILTSSVNGTTWNDRSKTKRLWGVTYANSTFMAVGNSGTIYTSSDGTTWTSRTSNTSKYLNGVTYGNSTFVTVGISGTILTSPDNGTTWTSKTSGTINELWGVTYANNTFVTVGYGGTILTSSDNGTTWTSRTSGTTNLLWRVTYANSTFVTVGNSGTILTSSDGTTWTSRTSGTTNNLYGVTYGNSTFVTVGDSGTILTSSDGTTWTSRTSGTTNNLYGVTTTTTTLLDPSSLTATGAAGQVTLDWTAVSSARGYTVYWDNATGVSSSSTAITSAITDNYTHTGLDNGTTYYYKVAAIDSAGTLGALSSEVSTATPLPAPDNLSASGANNTITLTWNSVSGATGYTLYWDNVSGIDNSDTAITSITNDNYTHSNMDNGSTYYYKVAAVNSSGTGTLSSVASALLSANIQGSQNYNAHTYAITSSAMTFANAKAAAAALGGYLTTINTLAENTFLTTRFYGTYGNAIWIGANDLNSEGTWVWDNGTTSGDDNLTDNLCGSNGCPISDATWADNSTRKWNSNEPNDYEDGDPGEDCANITNSNGYWNDLPCSNSLYGVIEFD